MCRIEDSNRVYPRASRLVRPKNHVDAGKLSSRKYRSRSHSYHINATACARVIAKCEGIRAPKASRVYPKRHRPFGRRFAERGENSAISAPPNSVRLCRDKRGVGQMEETRDAKERIVRRNEQRPRNPTDSFIRPESQN